MPREAVPDFSIPPFITTEACQTAGTDTHLFYTDITPVVRLPVVLDSCASRGGHSKMSNPPSPEPSVHRGVHCAAPSGHRVGAFDASLELDYAPALIFSPGTSIDFHITEDLWTTEFASLLSSSPRQFGPENTDGSWSLCGLRALAASLTAALEDSLQPCETYTLDVLRAHTSHPDYSHFRSTWISMRASLGRCSMTDSGSNHTIDDLRCLLSYLTASGKLLVAVDLVVVHELRDGESVRLHFDERPAAEGLSLSIPTRRIYLYHSGAGGRHHWESIGPNPSGPSYRIWMSVFRDFIGEWACLSAHFLDGSGSVSTATLSPSLHAQALASSHASVTFERHETSRAELTARYHSAQAPAEPTPLPQHRYPDFRNAFQTVWTADVDFVMDDAEDTSGLSSYGQWDTVQHLALRPELSLRIKNDITSASHLQLKFGDMVDGERATLFFHIEATDLDRKGVSGKKDNPITPWANVKRLRSTKWGTRIPADFRTSGMTNVPGQPSPALLENLQLFFIRATKRFISSANLALLTDAGATAIKSALCVTSSQEEHLEILCVRRSVVCASGNSSRPWSDSDHKLDIVIDAWKQAKSIHQGSVSSSVRPPYTLHSVQPIIINWTSTPCSSPHINWGINRGRIGAIPAIPGNFSINDLLHRKIGGVLAESRGDYESTKDLMKVEWDCWGAVYCVPSSVVASPEFAVLLLRPKGKAGRLPETDSVVHFSIDAIHGVNGVKAFVMEPLHYMRPGDMLLQVFPISSIDLTSFADQTINDLNPRVLWDSLQAHRLSHVTKIELREPPEAHACVLETLSALSHCGIEDIRPRPGTHSPAITWDESYHPGLLRLATCRESFRLKDGEEIVFIPHKVISRVRMWLSQTDDADLHLVAEGIRFALTYREFGPLVALLEGWAGSGKTRFLSMLLAALLEFGHTRIHFSAPANLPIDELVEKLIDFAGSESSYGSVRGKWADTVLVRGYTEASEWRLFSTVLQNARLAFAALPAGAVHKGRIERLSGRDSASSIAATLHAGLHGVWAQPIPSLAADDGCSLSRTMLRAIGLDPGRGGRQSPRSGAAFLIGPWAVYGAKLLHHVLAYVRGTTFRCEGERVTTIQEAWTQSAHALVPIIDILATTPVAGCSSLYRHFRPWLSVYDEANKGSMADWLALIAHLKPSKVLLCGDRRQLLPSAAASVGVGYKDSALSPFSEFLSKDIKVHTITTQRRSAHGLVDPAFEVFYKPPVPVRYIRAAIDYEKSHPLTHKVVTYLAPVLNDAAHQLRLFTPTVFLDTSDLKGITAKALLATSSTTNVANIPIVVGLIKELAEIPGIVLRDIAIVSGYASQLVLYRQALGNTMELAPELKGSGLDLRHVRTLTIDKCEGAQMRIVFLDLTVTHDGKFVDNWHRLLVGATRARDFLFIIGQPDTLNTAFADSPIKQLYRAYQVRRAVYRIPDSHGLVMTDVGRVDPGHYLIAASEHSEDEASSVHPRDHERLV